MAGDWIKWTKRLAWKPEVIRMATLMDRSRHEIAGLLMELWEWCDDNISDSNLSRNDRDAADAFVTLDAHAESHLDAIVGVQGFASSMASVGWLRVRNGRLEFPNYSLHNGETAKQRALASRRQQRKRAHEPPLSDPKTSRNARDGCHDPSVTREEERREEIKTPPPPRKAGGRKAGVLANLKAADLDDTARLVAVWHEVADGKSSLIPRSEQGKLILVALAERALAVCRSEGGNPRAVFGSLLTDPKAAEKAEAYIDVASKRLAVLRGLPSDAGRELAARIGAKP